MAHAPSIRRLDPTEHLQQGGFPSTVEADHSDAVAGLHAQAHTVQERFEPEGLVHIFQVNQIDHEVPSKSSAPGAGPVAVAVR